MPAISNLTPASRAAAEIGIPKQVTLLVPPEIELGLRTGVYRSYGSVVRDVNTGSIVRHLKEISLPDRETSQQIIRAATRASRTFSSSTTTLWVAAALAGIATIAADEVLSRFRLRYLDVIMESALLDYLDAAMAGELTVEIVTDLLNAIEDVKKQGQGHSLPLVESVVESIEGHTQALAGDSHAVPDNVTDLSLAAHERLERTLRIQRDLLEEAA